jgi:hypothetical protein
MSLAKTLGCAALLAVGTILATEAQAGFYPNSLDLQAKPAGWKPHPELPGAYPPGPYAP